MAVTIKDVAREAGTSTATVSKVLNGHYSISEETVQKVKEVVNRLNYRPNTRAKNFANQRTKQVLFLTTLGENAGFSNPHMFEILCGLEQALGQKGYMLIVKNIGTKEAPVFLQDIMGSQTVDAVIMHASVISKELDEMISNREIPHIVLGVPWFTSHFSWIDIDNTLAGEMAANYLLRCGYKSLAYIGGTEDDKISEHRLNGVLSVLKEYDVLVPKHYLQYGDSDCESGYHMTEELLKEDKIPEAIICANNYLAYGCVDALKDHNIRIPEQIGVLSFDTYPLSSIMTPKLTVIDIDVYNMGIQAGKIIINKIKNPNLHVQYYCTLPTIHIGESTKEEIM